MSSIRRFQNIGWQNPLNECGFAKKIITGIAKENSFIDIGCGDGFLLKKLLEKGSNRTGIGLDISDVAIGKAKEKGLDCRLFDITERLPFDDNSFEAALLVDVLEHLFQPDIVLKEARRVARKSVYISVPNFVSLPARAQVLFGEVPENNTVRKGHVFWATRGTIHQLINDAGLEIEQEFFNTFWENKPVLGGITKFFSRIWPELFALSFVVKAKKPICESHAVTEKELTDFYDDIYRKKGVAAMRSYNIYKETFKYLQPVSAGTKLLDVGCGTGHFLKAAYEAGLKPYGVDVSPEAVRVSRNNVLEANVVAARGESLPFSDHVFDYVACLGSLEHFFDMGKGLQEMIRVAKDNARFMFIVPNKNYLFWKFSGIYGTKQREVNEVLMDFRGWKNVFEKYGLRIEKAKHDRWPQRSVKIFRFKDPWRIMRRILYHLIWLFLPLKYTYQFIFVLKKENNL